MPKNDEPENEAHDAAASLIAFNYLGIVFSTVSVAASVRLPACPPASPTVSPSACLPVGQAGGGLRCVRWSLILSAC